MAARVTDQGTYLPFSNIASGKRSLINGTARPPWLYNWWTTCNNDRVFQRLTQALLGKQGGYLNVMHYLVSIKDGNAIFTKHGAHCAFPHTWTHKRYWQGFRDLNLQSWYNIDRKKFNHLLIPSVPREKAYVQLPLLKEVVRRMTIQDKIDQR